MPRHLGYVPSAAKRERLRASRRSRVSCGCLYKASLLDGFSSEALDQYQLVCIRARQLTLEHADPRS